MRILRKATLRVFLPLVYFFLAFLGGGLRPVPLRRRFQTAALFVPNVVYPVSPGAHLPHNLRTSE